MKPDSLVSSSGTVDLSVKLAGLALMNPITTASGTFGAGLEYADFIDLISLGAITTKGVSPVAWPGNPGCRIVETASGMLNSIGLQNPGVEEFCASTLSALKRTAPDATIIVNVVGHTAAEYRAVIERLESESNVHAYELNVSCPNLDAGGMAFGASCDSITDIVGLCRHATARPLIVKLTPNVTDIGEMARAAESAGADALSLINTLLGMSIDLRTMRPHLQRVVGGLSGPAIKPVALRMVWETSRAVSVPIIGMGGARSGLDVVEFMLAGATAVAVGTANFSDPMATTRCIAELEQFCVSRGIERASDLIGAMEVGR